jgi:hypothetical protein
VWTRVVHPPVEGAVAVLLSAAALEEDEGRPKKLEAAGALSGFLEGLMVAARCACACMYLCNIGRNSMQRPSEVTVFLGLNDTHI